MRQSAAIITVVVIGLAGMTAGEVVKAQGSLAADIMTSVREGPYLRTLPRGGVKRLGITVYELTPQLAEYFGAKRGVLIASVRDWSPADRAGLKVGDVVTEVNGTAVDTTIDLARLLKRDLTKAKLSISVTRWGRSQTVHVTVEQGGWQHVKVDHYGLSPSGGPTEPQDN